MLRIHLAALAVLFITVIYLAIRDDKVVEMALAAAVGFCGGLVLDRWVLRPTVDFSYTLARRP